MSSTMRRLVSAATALLLLSLAACGGGGGGSKSSEATSTTAKASLASQCPLGAIDKAAAKPVTITMWHSMTDANEATLKKLTDEFNSSQNDVRVKLVNQTSYLDTLAQYRAALSGGQLPDLVQIQEVDQRLIIDSQSVLPAQACVEADHVDLSDFVKRVTDYFTVDGTMWAMPFNVSNPVLYYDKALFEKAGLDPNRPPTTLDELRTDAQKIVQSGAAKYGFAFKLDAWYLEQWFAKAGQVYVNHDNGRNGRATAVSFDDALGKEIFSWLSGMVSDHLAEVTPQTGFDNLLALGNSTAGMTIDTSAALGTILTVLQSGQFPEVKLGVAPMPGPPGKGGVLVGGGSLYIVKRSSPEKQEAAWRFAKFLDEAKEQAEWSAGTGYLPIRKSATDLSPLKERWAEVPEFKIAYDQLLQGPNNAATAGPVIGDYEAVRTAVIKAFQAISHGTAPDAALAQAAKEANAAIKDYEARVGG